MAAVALLALMAVLLASTAAVTSGTPDEIGVHIPGGYLYWTGGEVTDGIDNLPLGQLVVAAPVALGGLEWELFSGEHLLLFRLPVVVLMLTAAAVLWRLVRSVAGPLAAMAALVLVATSPNLLAHGSLANLDGQITAWFVLFVAACDRFAARPSGRRLALVALVFGAAFATKGQSLLLPLIGAATLVAAGPPPRGSGSRGWWLAWWPVIPAAGLAAACASSLHLPLPGDGLLPARFAENLATQLGHSRGGHHAYLLGAYSEDGWWYYFPVAILTKTPLATLALLAVGLLRRPTRREVALLWAPAAVMLAAAIGSGLNIGLRHVLPAYPFLLAIAGIGAARLAAERRPRLLAPLLLVLAAAAGLTTHPHHLSFFNRLAGGSANGWRVLLDSNFDWGQADRFLARHVASTGLDYAIDPDPFRPTTGPILVNANARFGVSTAGPAVYRWLDGHRPVAQVARIWFEYRIPGPPPPPDPAALRRGVIERYVLDLRRRNPDLTAPPFRLRLARTLADVGSYRAALEEVRAMLRRDPAWEAPLWLGSELVLGRAMGALAFDGDEYLTGFREADPDPVPAVADVAAAVAGTPLARRLGDLLTLVGVERYRTGERAAARAAFREAVTVDPDHPTAAANLRRVGAAGAPTSG